MSELFIEIFKNSSLNKNTSTLVESYLLDLPVLPFIKELETKTFHILDDTEHYQCYTEYSCLHYSSNRILPGETRIYYNKRYKEWCVKCL